MSICSGRAADGYFLGAHDAACADCAGGYSAEYDLGDEGGGVEAGGEGATGLHGG